MKGKFNQLGTTLLRDINGDDHLENFLVAAVFAVLAVRFYIKLYAWQFGYDPILGGRELHIAHMLWGGLLMLISLIILFAFLNQSTKRLASIVAGIGFGIFIDEIGKFLTRDNNYFFQPAAAIIYVVFIGIFLATRAIERYQKVNKREYLANAVELIKDAIAGSFTEDDKKEALLYLRRSNKEDILVQRLQGIIEQIEPTPSNTPNIVTRFRRRLAELYKSITSNKWFSTILIIFFIVQAITSLAHTVISWLFAFTRLDELLSIPTRPITLTQQGELLSSAVAALFILAGIVTLAHSRLVAYTYFKRGILVSIFLTQFFAFYLTQFYALIGLAGNILILIALDYMISQEKHREM